MIAIVSLLVSLHLVLISSSLSCSAFLLHWFMFMSSLDQIRNLQ